jgi:hypothetical protein
MTAPVGGLAAYVPWIDCYQPGGERSVISGRNHQVGDTTFLVIMF